MQQKSSLCCIPETSSQPVRPQYLGGQITAAVESYWSGLEEGKEKVGLFLCTVFLPLKASSSSQRSWTTYLLHKRKQVPSKQKPPNGTASSSVPRIPLPLSSTTAGFIRLDGPQQLPQCCHVCTLLWGIQRYFSENLQRDAVIQSKVRHLELTSRPQYRSWCTFCSFKPDTSELKYSCQPFWETSWSWIDLEFR